MESLGLSFDMIVVLALLAFTVALFAFEIVRVDLAALLVMVTLGLLSQFPGLEKLADLNHLFDGFSSNAVISIIAVMIIGAGLDQTGLMNRVAKGIVKVGGNTESRLIPIISGTVGIISSFMQNVGAAALFLPVVSRISSRTGVPISRMLMPMGFCAILGGTVTMVGSSPLILLNDLILGVNGTLPEADKMRTFELFDVTPIGLALLATGIIYFVVAGRWILRDDTAKPDNPRNVLEYYQRIYSFTPRVHEVIVKPGSPLVGRGVLELVAEYGIDIIGIHFRGRTRMEPPGDILVEAPARLAIIANGAQLLVFAEQTGIEIDSTGSTFAEDLSTDKSGIAELVIPPDSSVIGRSAREIGIRKNHGLSVLALSRGGHSYSRSCAEQEETRASREDVGLMPLQAGDTLVCHTAWDSLVQLEDNHRRDYVVVTSNYPHDTFRPEKTIFALVFFLLALSLVLFSDIRLSLCLLVGATGMILSRVLSIDEAYKAIGWNTVFLLASLIPLGQAVQNTGTAEWIANLVVASMGGMSVLSLQIAVAILATIFTLVMSNVGATVLLVPLAVNIALAADADPALFALTVAISTSNSFLIPTHQVNALIMGPGNYSVLDFIRSGGVMTILFLIVSISVLNLIF